MYFSNFDVISLNLVKNRFLPPLNDALHRRPISFSLQVGDRAVLEIFPDNESSALEQQLVAHFVNPAEEVGGDSRLMSPPSSRIKSAEQKTGTQVMNVHHA